MKFLSMLYFLIMSILMGVLIDRNNVNPDNKFDENDPDTIILIRILTWHIKFEKFKTLEK